jgi:hypothetical protein
MTKFIKDKAPTDDESLKLKWMRESGEKYTH